MAEDIYATDKVLFHPDKLAEMRAGKQCYPVQIHLMPHNACCHSCSFCAYRLFGNKNTELFNTEDFIPWPVMEKIIEDFQDMGGKAIEITGGGEPLMYRHFEEMAMKIIARDFDYSLVSNGVLLTEKMAQLVAPKMTWARISVDAGTPKTYAEIRACPEQHFYRAIKAVEYLKKYAENKQFRLGVGFVVTNENYQEIYLLCKRAQEAGADNVRISACFHPDGMAYFTNDTIEHGKEDAAKAAQLLNSDTFHVYNLFDERISNIQAAKQDYVFCGTKELLCVIGGDCNAYLCCSLAFNHRGLVGGVKDGFKKLWDSRTKADHFSSFDASKRCPHMCLYEKRNKTINNLLRTDVPHINFI